MLACLLVVLTAACGNIPEPQVQAPEGRRFIPMVPDSIDDVGLAPSVAVDAEGLPTISYFGFPAQLEEGEIPVARPVGSPFLSTEDGDDAGAVLLAQLTPDQFWIRGAVAQPRESPAGVPVPFEPAAEPSLSTLTPARAKGTDLAIAGADIHTVWTVNTGVWYGVGPSFDIGPVEETPEAGAPSIVVDAAGLPIVAYTVAEDEPEVRVAERVGERWRISPVANLSGCGRGCPPATQIGLLGGEPLVVTADTLSGEVIGAHRQGGTWTSEVVATDATGGTSLATVGDTAAIAFTTRSGVALATGRVGSWSIEEVAPLAADGAGSAAPSTSVAVDGEGTAWVAWSDGDGIHLASRADGSFEEVELPVTTGGSGPSVAVTEDCASVYLAWYDEESGDLRLGAYAEVPDLVVAAPPPAPSVVAAPGPAGCGEDGQLVLDIVAAGTQFDPRCLVGPAAEPFTISFENQDPAPTQHNLEVLTEQGGDVIKGTEVAAGPVTQPLDMDPLDAGDYYFQCLVHPDVMTGTLAIVDGAGGGGGNGGGGGDGGGDAGDGG